MSQVITGFSHSLAPLAKSEAGQHGSDEDGEDERAEQSEADHPGHGLEEAAFDGLQGEDGQVGGDDHAARVEDGALHFVRGFADLLRWGDACLAAVAEVADDVFDHDDRAVDDHAEVERAEREQVGGNVAQVEADGGEEQRERHGERDDERAAHVAEEEEQDDDDEDDALGQVLEHGVGGVVEQIAAIEERNDLDAGRKDVDR